MIPLHRDRHYTFRFGDSRIIPRFHLDGVAVGVRVSVFGYDAATEMRLGPITTATVGEGGWVDLPEPIIVQSGEGFVAVPEGTDESPSGR
jgi:hypothetical protein